MKHNIALIQLTLTIVAIACCNANQIDEKLFGFLKSAEKCLKESNPEVCVKRNLNAWCEKRKDSFPEANVGTHVCGCVDGDSSAEAVRRCIEEKIATYCKANMDEFKCKIFERCTGEDKVDQKLSEKKECVKDFCQEPANTDKFECLAFDCKQNYSLPPQKLKCIKEACAKNGNKKICEKISACEAENTGNFLGKIKVFKCLRNSVFDGNDLD